MGINLWCKQSILGSSYRLCIQFYNRTSEEAVALESSTGCYPCSHQLMNHASKSFKPMTLACKQMVESAEFRICTRATKWSRKFPRGKGEWAFREIYIRRNSIKPRPLTPILANKFQKWITNLTYGGFSCVLMLIFTVTSLHQNDKFTETKAWTAEDRLSICIDNIFITSNFAFSGRRQSQ